MSPAAAGEPRGQRPVVAIDGPAGAGKSSVASAVASRLGFARLDTGAMYRAVTWAALRSGIDLADGAALAALAGGLEISFDERGLLIEGQGHEAEIRHPSVNASVSSVARHPAVRAVLVARQQKLAKAGGAVIEGRDIGRVVAPWAEVKIFLTASSAERARRRAGEMQEAGYEIDDEGLLGEIEARDARDNITTPLTPADGAVTIDSTGRTLDQVVDQIVGLVASMRDAR